ERVRRRETAAVRLELPRRAARADPRRAAGRGAARVGRAARARRRARRRRLRDGSRTAPRRGGEPGWGPPPRGAPAHARALRGARHRARAQPAVPPAARDGSLLAPLELGERLVGGRVVPRRPGTRDDDATPQAPEHPMAPLARVDGKEAEYQRAV